MNTRKITTILLRFSIITTALTFESSGYFPDSTFLPFADSLFVQSSDTQHTALRTKKDQRTYFMVTTCKTINIPFPAIITRLQSVDSYPEYFSFITKVVDVNEGDGPAKMLIGAYGLYRIYFFGKIHSEINADSSRYRVFCGDVEQKKYRKALRKRVRGLIKIGSYSTDIFWTVEKRSENSCRVSLTASQSFTTRTPTWMVSIGTNKIFKGMLRDLEKYMLKNNQPAVQEAPPAGLPVAAEETGAPPPTTEPAAPAGIIPMEGSSLQNNVQPAAAPAAEPDSSGSSPE